MTVFVCIDDTDSLESRGTGELADLLAREVEKRGWGTCGSITRHQLFVHPDIPYTSHNSSMCFNASMTGEHLGAFTEFAADFLASESADGSDPGLCIAVTERMRHSDRLVEFGYLAKRAVLEMKDAFGLASETGVHLSSHGGTGQGIIGALAGVGLRLGGNDGRMRGSLQIPSVDGVASVADILSNPEVDEVRTMEGVVLPDTGLIRFVDKVKTVLLGGKLVLLVLPEKNQTDAAGWRTCTRQQLKCY
ncbi:MAG: hypothetical protein EG824_06950 [Deltaproteobacteria bacterium]|nr:hypothetical protein [Deltaproteobacteria bacterium]